MSYLAFQKVQMHAGAIRKLNALSTLICVNIYGQ